MNSKQRAEITKMLNNQKYTKSWNFWAPLVRANIVHMEHKNDKVISISITSWGEVVYNH